jgi:hypothetical protein
MKEGFMIRQDSKGSRGYSISKHTFPKQIHTPKELRELTHSHSDSSTNLNRPREEIIVMGSGVTVLNSRFSIDLTKKENKNDVRQTRVGD